MNIRAVVKRFIPRALFRKIEPFGHLAEAVLFNVAYGFPARGMKVIGITGTNGKTTTTFIVQKMLHEAGLKTGMTTTVAWGVGDDIKPQMHHMTNVPVPELMQRLKYMRKQGVEWLVLETTSQALAQYRVWGVPYSVAVLTNMTHEHLDWHGTFENYVAAKQMLFKAVNKNKKGLQVGIVNADDPVSDSFAALVANPVFYGTNGGELRASNIKLAASGISYTANITDKSGAVTNYDIKCNLPGSFNVSNSLAAIAVGRAAGLSKEQIEKGIAALGGVDGRMTRVDEGQDFTVVVDYAHSPDSFEKLFTDLRPVIKGRLIVLFGSAGRRDEAKRPIQGALAGKYADEVVITEEDDRDADGMEIMEQIAKGAIENGKERDFNLFLIHDRTEAIKFALSQATSKDDTVLLLGKGHEKTIERGDREDPWNEVEVARTALRELLGKNKTK